MTARILVIDNYDSFVYNVVHYLALIGAEVEVWRNDDPRFSDSSWFEPFDGILISPGPGTPENAGECIRIINQLKGVRPIFGICLGLQTMAVAFGATVDRAPEVLHGKLSKVIHDGKGVFARLPQPLTATRYHSLAIVESTLPDCLEVSARTESGVIMAIRHRQYLVESVQFHPESVLTQGGYQILANWLKDCGDAEAVDRAKDLSPLISVS